MPSSEALRPRRRRSPTPPGNCRSQLGARRLLASSNDRAQVENDMSSPDVPRKSQHSRGVAAVTAALRTRMSCRSSLQSGSEDSACTFAGMRSDASPARETSVPTGNALADGVDVAAAIAHAKQLASRWQRSSEYRACCLDGVAYARSSIGSGSDVSPPYVEDASPRRSASPHDITASRLAAWVWPFSPASRSCRSSPGASRGADASGSFAAAVALAATQNACHKRSLATGRGRDLSPSTFAAGAARGGKSPDSFGVQSTAASTFVAGSWPPSPSTDTTMSPVTASGEGASSPRVRTGSMSPRSGGAPATARFGRFSLCRLSPRTGDDTDSDDRTRPSPPSPGTLDRLFPEVKLRRFSQVRPRSEASPERTREGCSGLGATMTPPVNGSGLNTCGGGVSLAGVSGVPGTLSGATASPASPTQALATAPELCSSSLCGTRMPSLAPIGNGAVVQGCAVGTLTTACAPADAISSPPRSLSPRPVFAVPHCGPSAGERTRYSMTTPRLSYANMRDLSPVPARTPVSICSSQRACVVPTPPAGNPQVMCVGGPVSSPGAVSQTSDPVSLVKSEAPVGPRLIVRPPPQTRPSISANRLNIGAVATPPRRRQVSTSIAGSPSSFGEKVSHNGPFSTRPSAPCFSYAPVATTARPLTPLRPRASVVATSPASPASPSAAIPAVPTPPVVPMPFPCFTTAVPTPRPVAKFSGVVSSFVHDPTATVGWDKNVCGSSGDCSNIGCSASFSQTLSAQLHAPVVSALPTVAAPGSLIQQHSPTRRKEICIAPRSSISGSGLCQGKSFGVNIPQGPRLRMSVRV
eukprot:TRINITY_DN14061_c0_g1_i1.p1 TRINITY_DN14061_c0_g1~~TRINITY_DN14061_c0_g1_i1.p1  ORF type:complete len:906 (-),score=117.71 TRINITY_DN14061_c0_g1_i1:163-2595(-)